MCDLRIASETAKFALPEINVGIMPGNGGTQRLVQNIPICRAKEMIFFGEPIGARDAYLLGLINRVVPQEELLPEARRWAEKLCDRPRHALAAAKQAVNAAWGCPTAVGAVMEAQLWSSLFATADQKEGMRAFLEKRRPHFGG